MAVLAWISFLKGYDGIAQVWGRPYWWLDYRHGFVRRGLAGSVFQAIFGRRDAAGLEGPLQGLTLLTFALLAAAFLFPLARGFWKRPGAALGVAGAACLWAASAQVWPHLAFNDGYLDAVVIAWAVGAALCLRAGWTWACAVMMFAGPLIHEYFVFLAPLVLTARRPADPAPVDHEVVSWEATEPPGRPELSWLVVVLTPLAAACVLVLFFYSREGTLAEVMAMPISAADRTILIDQSMSQTIGEATHYSLGQAVLSPRFLVKALLFFLAPSFACAAAVALLLRRSPVTAVARIVAAFAPLAALLIAFDVSRMIVISNIAAALLLAFSVEDAARLDAPEPPVRRGRVPMAILAGGLAIGALVYALAPMTYLYYPPGPEVLFPLRSWPGDGIKTFGFESLWRVTEVRKHPQT